MMVQQPGDESAEFLYTGLHAFVFIDHVEPGTTVREVVDRLRAFGPPPAGPVIFASEFVGHYSAFAHVRVEENDLAGLQDLIAGGLRQRGVHCSYHTEAKVYADAAGKKGTKRFTQEVIALSRIRVQPGRLDDVLQALGKLPTFKGASVLFGNTDILLQLGGDSYGDVAEIALNALQQVPGIAKTETAFADARRYGGG
jgi:DNA-binding Lrp family transcriptional regulator